MYKIITNPLIQIKLSIIRNKNTDSQSFYENLTDVASLMSPYVFADLNLKTEEIATPVANTLGYKASDKVLFVVILRAGLGFLEGFRRMVPFAKIGFLGMYRDEETLMPHDYYKRLPANLADYKIYLLDPMLATGGSACDAINSLKKAGAKDISFVGLVGAMDGIKKIEESNSDVKIYLASLDEKLNEKGYIIPGLGDCGDRTFGL